MDNIFGIQFEDSNASEEDLTMQNMFQVLSLELGGDGDIITKNQLNKYINEAKGGIIVISDKETEALNNFQNNWDSISSGDNAITYDNMKNYADILLSAIEGGISSTETNEVIIPETVDDVDAFFEETALNNSDIENNDSNLNLMLNSFIEIEDNDNIDIVQALNDLLAAS